eukprot:GILJ01009714.1.p1 GENE.GILJ01009714.1~~GILJ01009714.1.p1  ORF type:complete len:188 (-),score=16.50 GILJ01009714.1:119-682(-)
MSLMSISRLVSARCVLRPFHKGDESSLQLHANDAKVAANLLDAFPHPYTESDAKWWVEYCEKEYRITGFPTILAITIDNNVVGTISTFTRPYLQPGQLALGYWLGSAYWGHGIMSEVVPPFLRYIFEHTDTQEIVTDVFHWNKASEKVLRKSGFNVCGTRTQTKSGTLHECIELVIQRSQVLGPAET